MVTRLLAVCVVELVVVVLLALQVFAAPATAGPLPSDGTLPTPTAPASEAARAEVEVAAARLERPAPTAPVAAERQAVAATWNADDPVGVLLSGSVRWADDGGVVAAASVFTQRERKAISGDVREGHFAVAGLSPGTWQISLSGDGVRSESVAIELDERAVQQHDLVAHRSFPVKVRIVTADGADGTMAVRKEVGWGFSDFHVAAQAGPFAERYAPTDYGMLGLGDAKYDPEMNPHDGLAGTLHLSNRPPAHVALMQRHVVVAQQVVKPGQNEVTFVVDPAAMKAIAGSATVRVVDAATGQPIEGANVSFNSSNRGGGGSKTDADGRVTATGLSPGYLRCQIFAKDRAQFYTTVLVEVGKQLDVGEVRLDAPCKLTGMVVDADGKPVGGAQIRFTQLEQLGTAMPFASNRNWRSEADGSFSIHQAGRGRVALTAIARGEVAGLACAVFDNPPSEPVVLRLAAPVVCTITWSPDPTRTFHVMLFDAQRRPLTAVHLMSRGRPIYRTNLQMPPGDYPYEVRDQHHQLVKSGTLHFGAEPITLEIR